MPIYEFACPRCRVIFSFLSRRVNPAGPPPSCPQCGNKALRKQMSGFALLRGARGAEGELMEDPSTGTGQAPLPALDDPRLGRAMAEIEREMGQLDELNPTHMARIMRKMKDVLPPSPLAKDLEVAIQRLEAGESPEKIEQDMGDIVGDAFGGMNAEGGAGGYTRDDALHEY